MKTILALILLSGCAAEMADADTVDVDEEALTVSCYPSNVTSLQTGHPPPYFTQSIAGYMAWQGGFQPKNCTNLYGQHPSCTNTSGASGTVTFVDGWPVHQWIGGEPFGRFAVFDYVIDESGDSFNSPVNFSDNLGTRYGHGTIKATHPNAGNVWKVELCVVKCTQSAPGC